MMAQAGTSRPVPRNVGGRVRPRPILPWLKRYSRWLEDRVRLNAGALLSVGGLPRCLPPLEPGVPPPRDRCFPAVSGIITSAMDCYLAGYYLVDGLPRPPQMAAFLPPMLWSISSCLCAIYPDTWALSWVTQTPVDRAAMQTRLGLDAAGFQTLQAQIDAEFDQQRFGWPNVWLDRAAAKQFQRQYLATFPHVKLLAIALPAPCLDTFLRNSTPAPNFGESGLYQMLSRRNKLTDQAGTLGYEILGVEDGGSCHSFLCNYLEVPYQQQLHVRFNEHGLIDFYDDAVRAADFTNLDSTGAEPVPWYPWLVVELPTTHSGDNGPDAR